MPQQIINLGATGSGAGGDSARTAFEKAIANFAELYIAALPGTAAQKQAARDVFGLGTAATKAAQTGPTDTTAGALMAVGAFGLGGTGGLNPVSNVNTPDLRQGIYGADSSAIGAAAARRHSFIDMGWTSTERVQLAGLAQEQKLMFRSRYTTLEGVWNPWRELFHTGNVLGTVSQSGGVPTGAIIERGSNANGEYVRFADGTQICLMTGSQPYADSPVHAQLPAAFSSPLYFPVANALTDAPTQRFASVSRGTPGSVYIYTAGSVGTSVSYSIIIIGRWF